MGNLRQPDRCGLSMRSILVWPSQGRQSGLKIAVRRTLSQPAPNSIQQRCRNSTRRRNLLPKTLQLSSEMPPLGFPSSAQDCKNRIVAISALNMDMAAIGDLISKSAVALE